MTVVGKDFLFVHVPKSAGKSVAAYLGGTTKGIPSHAPLWYLREELGLTQYAFGAVRNPWARMVSAYAFISQKPLRKHESADYQRDVADRGFRDWLLNDAFFSHEDALWDVPARAAFQRRSQEFWLKGCDYICKVETLVQDLKQVSKHITMPRRRYFGLLGRPELKQKNTSSHGSYRDYYDEETRAFIALHFAWEIGEFGYSFE